MLSFYLKYKPMKSIIALLFAIALLLLGSSCFECVNCMSTRQLISDGQVQSTTERPYEFCGTPGEINQEEYSTTSTTTRADGSVTVWTTTVVCD